MAFEPIVRLTMHAVGLDGGLYVCNPFSLEVDLLLQNNSESCKEIKRRCEFKGGIAFTDSGDQKVKFFGPSEKNVKTLMGPGQERASDGTDETCSFTQVRGICFMEKVALNQHRDSVVLCRSYKSLEVSITVLVSKPKA